MQWYASWFGAWLHSTMNYNQVDGTALFQEAVNIQDNVDLTNTGGGGVVKILGESNCTVNRITICSAEYCPKVTILFTIVSLTVP